MKLLRYWKLLAGLFLVFAAGAVTGSAVTHEMIKRGIEHALNFDRWQSSVMNVLQSKLNLNNEQHAHIAAAVHTRGQEIRDAFSHAFNDSGHAMVRLQKEIDETLTPEQKAIHAKMKQDFRAELKRKFNYDLPED